MNLFLLLIVTGSLIGQDYDVTIWGVSIGSANIRQATDEEISLKIKAHDFVDPVFPVNLVYSSKFDKRTFTVIENNKTTEQGSDEQNYEAILTDGNILVYDDKDSISLDTNTFSLLSLLVKIINSPVDSIDTKWLNVVNEGILYETRPLWNDTTIISINGEDVLCDHYRLDLKIGNDDKKLFDKTDYFNQLFFDINSIRQLWVGTWQKQQRLIKISIKNNLINLSLTINN